LSRSAAAVAALLCLWPAAARQAEGEPPDAYPRAGKAYLVAIDGAEVWARAADRPLPPASLTKLMTALLVLEAQEDPGTWVRVSALSARETGSRLGLREGEALSLEGALTATLVSSANDACLALAEHVAGSGPAFVARMNARAQKLGLGATHFQNPCGHDAAGHVSSARDLLRLARAALAFPEFRRMVALKEATVATRGGRSFALRTHNLLLGRLRGALGVKSGYTEGAGRCMVALAVRDGVEVLAVLLDSPDRWWTTAALVELAFDEAHRHG